MQTGIGLTVTLHRLGAASASAGARSPGGASGMGDAPGPVQAPGLLGDTASARPARLHGDLDRARQLLGLSPR